MKNVIVDNDLIHGVEMELGKRYVISDEFYDGLTGVLVNISDCYISVEEDDIDVYDELNITLQDDSRKHTIFVSDIDSVVEIGLESTY